MTQQTNTIRKELNKLWKIQSTLKSNSSISYILKSILNLEDCLKEEEAFNNNLKGGINKNERTK